ncbi:MAG: GYD domain-containing protein [Phycisphaerae bacterium]|nr:GYD domain-containing protein [Phycisphaerae bacterium]
MNTFISLLNFTERGVAGFRDTTAREDAFADAAKKAGLKIRDVYWTLGPYDGVLVFDAPDDKAATSAMLALTAHGFVRSQTLRAFDRAEMNEIVTQAIDY